MRRTIEITCFLLLASFFAISAFGQAEAGSISGTVRDSSGAVVPNATVTVKSASTGAERSTKTGAIGQYNIPGSNAWTLRGNGYQQTSAARSGGARAETNWRG
jgi:hypothetical protein